jgi:hypothetical protein
MHSEERESPKEESRNTKSAISGRNQRETGSQTGLV